MASEMTKKSSHERCRSISGTVIKFARRSNSSSTNLEVPANKESEPPLPHPRSSSFFNSLHAFVPRAAVKNNNSLISKGATTPASRPVQSPHKLPQRFSHPPPSLSSEYSCTNGSELLIPKVNADGCKTTIMQRGLMKPSTNPPLLRSSTMISRAPQQPSFMRPTSSSTAHNTALSVRSSSNYGPAARSSRLPSTTMSPEYLSSVSRATKTPRISDCLEKRTNTVGTPLTSEGQKCKPNGGRYSDMTHISARSPKLVLTSQIPEDRKGLIGSDPLDEEDSEEDSEDDYYEPTLETRLLNDNPSICGPPMIRTAQPTSYWLGRLTAISDRCRTEALPSSSSSKTVHEISSMHDESRRIRYSFIHLRNLCCTREATESLEKFQQLWLDNERRQEWRRLGGSGEKRVKEKRGVFEILRGRKTVTGGG